MSDRNGHVTLQELVGNALREGVDLARTEFGLFRAEMASNAAGIAKGVALFGAAAVFAVASLVWLTQAVVYGLDLVTGRPWVSALIVGGVLLLVAAVLAIIGKRMMSSSSLTPTRTVRSLKRDGEILSERAV